MQNLDGLSLAPKGRTRMKHRSHGKAKAGAGSKRRQGFSADYRRIGSHRQGVSDSRRHASQVMGRHGFQL